jgi:methionyl-tRNA formyltransferase
VALEALYRAGHEIALVVSRADARRGRRGVPAPSPVKAAALELGLPVSDDPRDATTAGADLGVVVAFGLLIRRAVLAELAMVNLHFSLLPRWRGAAPVERAILAGDELTGVCLMDVEEGLDMGGVRARTEVAIGPDETASELRHRLAAIGAALLVESLARGLPDPVPQMGDATYADKIRTEDLLLDWHRPAAELARVVRVGGAHTTWRGRRLKVWRSRVLDAPPADVIAMAPGELADTVVATGLGALELLEVQPEGRGRQDAASWRRGQRDVVPGERFGS